MKKIYAGLSQERRWETVKWTYDFKPVKAEIVASTGDKDISHSSVTHPALAHQMLVLGVRPQLTEQGTQSTHVALQQ